MRPIQLDLFCKPSPEVIHRIIRSCEEPSGKKNQVKRTISIKHV